VILEKVGEVVSRWMIKEPVKSVVFGHFLEDFER
jgi:hypothetical protein